VIRSPNPDERAFVLNRSEASVSFGSNTLLVVKRGCGVWVADYWPSFDDFCHDEAVMALHRRQRISVEYRPLDGMEVV